MSRMGSKLPSALVQPTCPRHQSPIPLAVIRAKQCLGWRDAVTANIESLAATIRGEPEYLFSDFEKVHNIEVLEAIGQSADTGQMVRLEGN